MKKNILQLLENSACRFPDKVAFSDKEGQVTYADAVKEAKAIGTYLASSGKRRTAVAVLQEKGKDMLVSFMGIVYSGNFYIPIDTEMPNDRIERIFDTVQPFAIITDENYFEKAKAIGANTDIILFSKGVETPIDEEIIQKVRDKAIDTDPVYSLFTSGSTGIPKGVICCHRSVIDYADWLTDTFQFDENTIFGNQTPFYFSMSVLDIYATIRSGAELHVIPKQFFAFPNKLLNHLNERKINSIYWVPTALCIVANLKALDKMELPYLKKILFAGEPMPVKQLNMWRKHLPNALYANLFGPTEITDIGIYYIVNREFADDEALPIGNTCDNVDALILDEEGREVPDGEIGELCIRGSYLALGYYNNAEKTREVFVQNPLNPNYPELIYKTGDLVSVNKYGELMYHGRKDFQIKHRGNRIELGEIENAAGCVPGIEMCACIYDTDKEKIVLFFQGSNVTDKDIRKYMSEKIPSYMLPNVMLSLEEMPKNQNGKVDRKELSAIYKKKI
ncbi:MAG: amino acid adenylation domain-containing protein [Roseburia sp.]|nr:amino acid adenylation domain-containing protein [Roseburia sp.]